MSQLDKPNLRLSLVPSYNTRGFVNSSGSSDQRKVNLLYQTAKNPITGKLTTYLEKRPGILSGSDFAGTSTDDPYLITGNGFDTWMFSKNTVSNAIKAQNTSTTTTIDTDADRYPAFVSKMLVSTTETVILQLRHTSEDLNAAQDVFYSSTIGTWTAISDAQFTANKVQGQMEAIDGYSLYLDENNRVNNSDVNSISAWTAGQYTTKNIRQDLPMGLARRGQLILAFGMETVEVFYNASNTSGSPLGRLPQLETSIGLGVNARNGAGGRSYYAELGGRIYFVGNTKGLSQNNLGFYSFDGSRFEKISTDAIDSILVSRASFISWVGTLPVFGRMAIAIATTYRNTATQTWLMFFPEWNEWFEWESTAFQPVNSGDAWIGIGGSAFNLEQGVMNTVGYRDGASTSYSGVIQLRIPRTGNHSKFMPMFSLEGDTATSASTVGIEFSDDDGQTWSTSRDIDMTSQKKAIYRCGGFRDRLVRMTHSTNNALRLEALAARIDD